MLEKVKIGISIKDGRNEEVNGGGRLESRRRKHGGGIKSKRRENSRW